MVRYFLYLLTFFCLVNLYIMKLKFLNLDVVKLFCCCLWYRIYYFLVSTLNLCSGKGNPRKASAFFGWFSYWAICPSVAREIFFSFFFNLFCYFIFLRRRKSLNDVIKMRDEERRSGKENP